MIVLLGESGCGKTTVAKILQQKYQMKSVVSYTTRPPRDGEIDGVDYHFVSEKEFSRLKKNGSFAETAKYRNWYYGTVTRDYEDNAVAILTPHGLRQVLGHDFPSNIVSFYLDVPRRERLIRILKRGDDIEEAYRRSLSDVGQFDGVWDEVNYRICSDKSLRSPHAIADRIWMLHDKMLLARDI